MLKGRVKLASSKKVETTVPVAEPEPVVQKKSVSRTKSKVKDLKESPELSLESLAKVRTKPVKKEAYEFGRNTSNS